MKRLISNLTWVLAAACGSELDVDGDLASQSTATATVMLQAGAPTPGVTALVVSVERVEVHTSGGDWRTLPGELDTLDLTKLSEDVLAALGTGDLEPGRYTQLRIIVSDAVVQINNAYYPVNVPSGEESGIKLTPQWEITSGADTTLVAEIDLAKSLVTQGDGTYSFKPVVRIVAITE